MRGGAGRTRTSSAEQQMFVDAVQHHQAGRLNEAVSCYRSVIDRKRDHADAYCNLGVALQQQGRFEQAAACYRKAIGLKPDDPQMHLNLGLALQDLDRFEAAAACFGRAIELRVNYPEAYNNLGICFREMGLADEAVACFRRALDLRPGFHQALSNLGISLQAQGFLVQAVACFRLAIDLSPDFADAHNNLGFALLEQGRLDEATACISEAVRLRPGFPDAHHNLAITRLMRGEMEAGWSELEWRWRTPQLIRHRRDFAQPQWRGEAAEGQTLLIHAEQGFGDTLQFCRYATLAAARGLKVIMEVPKPLVRLLRSVAGVDLVVSRGEDLPPFDLHCPMLSMPLALGTTLATIPDGEPYLHAEKAFVVDWRTRLSVLGQQGPRIGLVWAGNGALRADRRRSIDPVRLAPLFHLPGLRLFSLQKAGPPAPDGFPVTDLMQEVEDFADTAALIANLDLVISVDTAVAHLAAAMGKPVWLLNRFDTDWRWLVGRRDSPWYPSLRIYRQSDPGDWDPVVAEVARDLAGLVSQSATALCSVGS
jgi:Flp pilus assembly protein TadD